MKNSVLAREIRHIFADPWLLSLVSWVPLVIFLLMWLIFTNGVVANIPVGVIDQDNSAMSRQLIRKFDANQAILVARNYTNFRAAEKDLLTGKIYGLIVVPVEMSRDVITGKTPQVTAFVNNQFLLMGKVLKSAIMSVESSYSVRIETSKNMGKSNPVFSLALSAASPIGSQVTPMFNRNRDYAQFLLAAIFPAIWQVVMVVTCIISLAGEQRLGGLTRWLGGSPAKSIMGKMLVLGSVFFLQGISFLNVMYVMAGWPMHGKWSILLAAQLMTILASMSVAFMIFFVVKDASRSLSVAASYVGPALAFMGVTFPATDMNLPARIWRSLLPVSHYIDIQFGQVNYGCSLATARPYFMALSAFIIPAVIVFLLGSKIAGAGTSPASPPGRSEAAL
ncbi:MAG: multidrug ABC transporter permease [Deltaproteobacteria bacterium]|nr:MAG: multidrug ABC transporter permease [Deltaproteobacteria bacterium]